MDARSQERSGTRGVVRSLARASARPCARPACPAPAQATLSFRYGSREAFIGPLLEERDPNTYDLCLAHAERTKPPHGWGLVDERPTEPIPGPPVALGDDRTVALLAAALGRARAADSDAVEPPLSRAAAELARAHGGSDVDVARDADADAVAFTAPAGPDLTGPNLAVPDLTGPDIDGEPLPNPAPLVRQAKAPLALRSDAPGYPAITVHEVRLPTLEAEADLTGLDEDVLLLTEALAEVASAVPSVAPAVPVLPPDGTARSW